MANSTRAPAFVRARKTRAPARAGTKSAAKKEKRRAPLKRDGRCLSRRIEFTPRLTEHIRRRYEEAGDSPEVIARSLGVAKGTIQRLVREYAWTPAERAPRDLSRAEQLAAEARALAARANTDRHPEVAAKRPSKDDSPCAVNTGGRSSFEARSLRDLAPQDDGGGEEGAAPVDVSEQIERLLRLVSAEIGVYENLRATLKSEPQAQREAQKTMQVLASLASTLDTLRRMRAGQNAIGSHDDTDDDLPTDIDELRHALARRIEAFFANRPDDGDAAGDEPARTDGA